jgi:N-acetylglucosamine kinase-like BadF-type ATPase
VTRCAVLGVDGGNTKTEALVADEAGNVLGYGRSGCSDIYGARSSEAALVELDRAVQAALAGASLPAAAISAATFSLAGADWPEDFDFLRMALVDRGFSRNVSIYNDALAPLRAGSDDFTGVTVVCGTGAAVGARSAAGHIWHASWWLDVQGARQLGSRALHAVMHAELGLGPATSMSGAVLEAYSVPSVEELVHRLTHRVSGQWLPEPAARVLVAEATAGDRVATQITTDHGHRLGDYALVAARKAGLDPVRRLILAGSVLRNSSVMTEALVSRVREEHAETEAVMPQLTPVAGAVLLSLDQAGIAVTPSIRERLLKGQSWDRKRVT